MRHRKTKKSKRSAKLLVGILIIAGLGVTAAANGFAFSGFHATTLQQKIQKLAEENEELELKITNLKSLQNLKDKLQTESGFVPVDQIKYLPSRGEVAPGSVGQK